MVKKSTIGFVLLVLLLASATPIDAQDILLKELYLKTGAVVKCDFAWKGLADFAWCSLDGNLRGYPAGQVDMIKTFEVPLQTARLVNQSRESFNSRHWDEAIRAATSAISLDPKNEVAYTNRAGACTEKGLLQEAIRDCNRALDINPDYALAYNNRGYAKEKAGNISEAVADYDMSCRMGNEFACRNLKRIKRSVK